MLIKKIQILFLLGIVFPFSILAQETEKEINAPIESVRIFLRGGEIIRTSRTTLPKGKHKLIFTGLSSNMNASSIQISTDGGDVNMLSTTSKINFLKEDKKTNPKILVLKDSLQIVSDGMIALANQESAFQQEKKVLESNYILSGKEKPVDFEQLKNTATYFRVRFLAINTEISAINKKKAKLQIRKRNLQKQLNELNAGRRTTSEVYLVVDCKSTVTTEFRLRYVVQNAGWSPIYDLSVQDLSEPMKIKYRALAFNNTGINWENVNVSLSTADPYQTATLPVLNPWNIRQDNSEKLLYEQGILNSTQNNVYIQKDRKKVDGYAYEKNQQAQPQLQEGAAIRFEEIEISELSNDFEITDRHSIPSDSKPYSIAIYEKDLKANYKHYSVPKMDKDAFLIGQVTGWEDLDLIPGPMNIYYDKSFIGVAQLDTRNLNDTLNLSLGRDPKVLVKRIKMKELTKKQFLQNKKKMTVAYKMTVKNNRDQPVNLELLDQIPRSNLKEIDIDVKEISGADYFENTGKLTWNLDLKPGESKTVEFSFSITYPKNMEIKIDKNRKMVVPRYF